MRTLREGRVNPHLFVYGTLLSTAGHPMGTRLGREAKLIGQASIAGVLYRLGQYPGLIASADLQKRVHGEVFALNNPEASLTWLDAYEGIVPGDEQNEYQRVERDVQLASGEELAVWVYLYRKKPQGQPIASGRWLASS
jgi:gamma-glutamylcyclotransferase (GGCT)/AIG2-like uncharacterized protein YtfP